MSKCEHHPGRNADSDTSFNKKFCIQCAEQIKKAQQSVKSHVEPKECFIIYKGGATGWETFSGTGCAHWVAHQRDIKKGFSSDKCAEGYSIRVPDVISGARKIDQKQEEVKVDDIWRGFVPMDHCGLVVRIQEIKGKDDEVKQKITIRHCSSGQGRVLDSDFETYFKGKGDFYRR
jgi:hypothetical protein